MPETERASLDDVRRVAELANLELTPDEESRMRRDLNAILDYIAQLGELDTASVEPMAQVSEIKVSEVLASASEAPSEKQSVLRDDELRPCLDRAVVMASAPETDSIFFKVPRVIER